MYMYMYMYVYTHLGKLLKLIVTQLPQHQFSSVQSHSRPNGLQHARPPYPSPTPRDYSNSCP